MDTSFKLATQSPFEDDNCKQYSISELENMRDEIRSSIGVLSTYCLYFSSKWSAELLISINKQIQIQKQSQKTQLNNNNNKKKQNKYKNYSQNLSSLSDNCLLAKTYFDLKDYNRVIETLKNDPATSSSSSSSYAFFLLSYAQYLNGEKKKEEEIQESNNQFISSNIQNKSLKLILNNINERDDKMKDSFYYFIRGIVLRELSYDIESISSFILSVNLYPYNWSAWRSLAELIISEKIFISVKSSLFSHWICDIFIAEVMVEITEFYDISSIIQYFNNLLHKFSCCPYILGQTALILYNLHRFDECLLIFKKLLLIDKYRIDLLDIYSNILYVKEMRCELSYLAHKCIDNDKYRSETCCIIGNYYGMYGMHEKAILYFERALSLNNNFISALVLMGHEYIEMRNEIAAIQCYRKSCDLNKRDYRGWYGLGQTYELLQMYNYSIFYYNKVCKLRPYDYRMWCALGNCYKYLSNIQLAIKSYQRAENICATNNSKQQQQTSANNLCTLTLAKLYYINNNLKKSKKKYIKYIKLLNIDNNNNNKYLNDDTIEALIRLSEMSLNINDYKNAKKYSKYIIKYSQIKGKDIANKILQQISNRQNTQQQQQDDDDMEISFIS